MTKRRDAGRTTPPADALPERAAVERAIEAVLDRLRPKEAAKQASRSEPGPSAKKPSGSPASRASPGGAPRRPGRRDA